MQMLYRLIESCNTSGGVVDHPIVNQPCREVIHVGLGRFNRDVVRVPQNTCSLSEHCISKVNPSLLHDSTHIIPINQEFAHTCIVRQLVPQQPSRILESDAHELSCSDPMLRPRLVRARLQCRAHNPSPMYDSAEDSE